MAPALKKQLLSIFIFMMVLLLFVPTILYAGNWRVSPIKLYFDLRTRSDVLTVTNDGDEELSLEVKAMEWFQNENGDDIYQEATDLIFFPKQLTVEPDKERVIRAGIKVPATKKEKTYRLFIKEVPDRKKAEANTVAIAIQFGVPVFIKPSEEILEGRISDLSIDKGVATIKIRNEGNSHFRIKTLTLEGLDLKNNPIFNHEISGWYLLSGRSKAYTAEIPADICQNVKVLNVLVDSESLKISESINVDRAMCSVN